MQMFRPIAAGALALMLATPIAAHDFRRGTISIAHPWTRQTAPGQASAGGFRPVPNTEKQPARLTGGSPPATAKVEIHTMSMTGGVMRMRPLPNGLPVPAGGKLELKPGSHHIMLIGLKKPLKLGTLVPLTLRFERAGMVTVQLKVEAITYGTGAGHDH